MARTLNAGYTYDITSGSAQLATAIEQTLSNTFTQTERPTISYHPLDGADYLGRMLRPLSFKEVYEFVLAGWDLSRVLRLTVQRVGPVHNAMYSNRPVGPNTPKDYQLYRKVSHDLSVLENKRLLSYRLVEIQKEPYIEILVRGGLPEDLAKALKLPPHIDSFVLGSKKLPSREKPTLIVKTRSIMEIMYFLSKGVEVPQTHVKQHFVRETYDSDHKRFNWVDTTKHVVHIKSSKRPPRHYFVRVFYSGYWFFIPKSFDNSKQTFTLLQTIFPIVVHDKGSKAPTYTLAL